MQPALQTGTAGDTIQLPLYVKNQDGTASPFDLSAYGTPVYTVFLQNPTNQVISSVLNAAITVSSVTFPAAYVFGSGDTATVPLAQATAFPTVTFKTVKTMFPVAGSWEYEVQIVSGDGTITTKSQTGTIVIGRSLS